MAKQSSKPESTPVPDRRETLLEGQDLGDEVGAGAPPPAEAVPAEEAPAAPESSATDTSPVEPETTPETAAPAEPSFLDQAKSLGYEGDDEQEAAMLLLESYQQVMRQRQEYEQRVGELERLAEYGNEYLQQQRKAKEEEEKAAQPAEPGREPWWNPPKFETKWIEQYRDVTLDENGQPVIGWKKNTPREVQEAAGQYQQYLEQWAADLVQRPQEVLPKIIEQEFDRLFEERIRDREQAQNLSSFAERVVESNRDWMYTQDSQGRDVLTAEGQAMTKILSEVAQSGVTDPQMQWQYAVAMYDYLNRANQAAAAAQSTTAQETAAQKRRQQLQRGAPQPTANRTGTVQRPEEEATRPQNPHLTPGQQLLQQLRQDGADFV